jgi:hypothetical protein
MSANRVFLVFLALSLGALYQAKAQTCTSSGTTLNAATCNESDVTACFSAATSSTTQINIPAGSCSWSSPASFSVPTGNTNLTIQGQTSCTGSGDPALNNLACTDNTLITDNVAYTSSDPGMLVITTGSGPLRITGLSITGNGTTQTYHGGLIINGTSTQVRVDHNHIYNINTINFDTTGITGVFDHNIIQGAVGAGWSQNGDGSGFGDAQWAAVTGLGSSNFLYYEQNEFINGGNDCYLGGRWAIRFNTFQQQQGTGFVQTHPTGGSGRNRGCRAWELYGNNFSTNGETAFNVFFLSSGTGVIWGNTASTGQIENFVTLHSMRTDNSAYTQTATPNGWGYCGTAFDGTGSGWDQNSNLTTGYHCLDQPGMGKSDLLSGSFPNVIDSLLSLLGWPNQASEPLYEWNDAFTPAAGYSGTFWNIYQTTEFVANSDYYLWCNASSPTGCTTFNGTAGVGSGALASAPATCTKGVGYWATDQGNWNTSGNGSGNGVLYICGSSNNWVATYTPYAYPHPLDSTTPVPAPPTLTTPLTATPAPQ